MNIRTTMILKAKQLLTMKNYRLFVTAVIAFSPIASFATISTGSTNILAVLKTVLQAVTVFGYIAGIGLGLYTARKSLQRDSQESPMKGYVTSVILCAIASGTLYATFLVEAGLTASGSSTFTVPSIS